MLEYDPLRTLLEIGLIIEAVVALAVLLVPALRRRAAEAVARWLPAFDWLAERRGRAVLVCGGVALAACVAAAVVRPPAPRVHDEFSYLLGADTFARGRLTNPTPFSRPGEQADAGEAEGAGVDLARHFESEHVLVRPTYSSKYPPAQAVVLAVGKVVFGSPIVGVWLSTALLCAAICWMLQAWTTPRYALLGGLLCALHVGVIGWWGNTYWGGSVAGLGGALLFGALRRLFDREDGPGSVRDSSLLGVGVALLAASRPYEGLLACLPAAGVFAWMLLGRLGEPRAMLRIAGPAAAVLTMAGVGLAAHNRAVTGDALTFPYTAHGAEYSATPMFVWQSAPEQPAYAHRHLEDFHAGWELKRFQRQDAVGEFPLIALEKSIALWLFYVGSAFTLLLGVRAVAAWRGRRWRPVSRRGVEGWTLFALVTCGIVFAGMLAIPWMNPHYLAPIFALVVFLLMRWVERLEHAARGGQVVLVALGALVSARLAAFAWLLPGLIMSYPAASGAWHLQRAAMQRELEGTPEKDLVLVRHGREYRPHEEWVYNGADLDRAGVVWAWELEAGSNAALLERLGHRRPWLLEAYRSEPAVLVEYPPVPRWLLQDPALLPGGSDAAALAAGDVDGDGRAEVLTFSASEGGARLSAVFAWRDGVFVSVPTEEAEAAIASGRIVVNEDPLRASVDLDGDGSDEIVIVNPPEDTMSIFSSTTLPLAGVTVRTGINATGVVAMDVDHDGDKDLVVASVHGHGLAITRNENGNLSPSAAMVTVGARTWFEDKLRLVAAADVDGDGRDDLIVAGPAGAFVYLTSADPG